MDELLALSDGEQEALLKRLTLYAQCKMRRLTWRGVHARRGGTAPGGHEPYDFALDAIQKLLDGSRSWDRQKYPTLVAVLRAIIDSDINHLADSIDNPAAVDATVDATSASLNDGALPVLCRSAQLSETQKPQSISPEHGAIVSKRIRCHGCSAG